MLPMPKLSVKQYRALTAVAANSTGKTRARVGGSCGRATPDVRFPQLVICDVANPRIAAPEMFPNDFALPH